MHKIRGIKNILWGQTSRDLDVKREDAPTSKPQEEPEYVKIFKERVFKAAGQDLPLFTDNDSPVMRHIAAIKRPLQIHWEKNRKFTVSGLRGISWSTNQKGSSFGLQMGSICGPSPDERRGWSWPGWVPDPTFEGEHDYHWKSKISDLLVEHPSRFTKAAKAHEILATPEARSAWRDTLTALFRALQKSVGGYPLQEPNLYELTDSLHDWCDTVEQFRKEVIEPLNYYHNDWIFRDELPSLPYRDLCKHLSDQRWNTAKAMLQARAEGPDSNKKLQAQTDLFLYLGAALYRAVFSLRHAPILDPSEPFDLHTRKIHLLCLRQQLSFFEEDRETEEVTLEAFLAPLKRDIAILEAKSWDEIDEPEAKVMVEEVECYWAKRASTHN